MSSMKVTKKKKNLPKKISKYYKNISGKMDNGERGKSVKLSDYI